MNDCYEGTACLINKLGIHDDKKLEVAEGIITASNASLLEQQPMPGWYNLEHYKAIHRFLFYDIYEWAGEIREVELAKQRTRFVPAYEIERVGNAIFARVQKSLAQPRQSLKGCAKTTAQLYNELNMLHPFREGNGRTQRAFFAQLIRQAGYEINFGAADRDLLTFAVIQAAGGVMDHLQDFFLENLKMQEYRD